MFRLKLIERTHDFVILLFGKECHPKLKFGVDDLLLCICPLWPVGELSNVPIPRFNRIGVLSLTEPYRSNLKSGGHSQSMVMFGERFAWIFSVPCFGGDFEPFIV